MRRFASLLAALVSVSVLAGPAASTAEGDATVRRLAGADRYATAASVALDRWTSGSDVLLANGDDPADALAGAFGSGLHSSPVYLTERDVLPQATLEALRSVSPRTIHVLGGPAAISEAVVEQLRAEGWTPRRHAGVDRFGTAVALALSEGPDIVGWWRGEGRTAILANGRRPFDALAGGPLSAGQLFPLLLTETDAVPAVTMDGLDDLGIRHVIVLGGTGSVSDGVVAAIEASGRTVRRVAGADRAATAVAVAGLLEELDYEIVRVALTSAGSTADALGAGPWAAPRTPVLLCETSTSCGAATLGWAGTRAVDEVVVIGGTARVSDEAAYEVAAAGR